MANDQLYSSKTSQMTTKNTIIICEDDHQFTNQYSKELLLSCIQEAQGKEADVLLCAVSSGLSIVSGSKYLF